MERLVATSPKRETMASRNDIVILCIADSVTRLTYIARKSGDEKAVTVTKKR
jgi:hypothetical protein